MGTAVFQDERSRVPEKSDANSAGDDWLRTNGPALLFAGWRTRAYSGACRRRPATHWSGGERNGGKPIKVVANLPYYITTPIIMGLFESHVPLDSITIMVQKEVADRMQVGPGTKDYGALSLAVQYYAKPQILLNVPASCFMPRPNVDSAVIQLTRYEKPPVEVADEHLMFRLIRASFNQRRKTMTNSVGNSPELSVSKEQMAAALEKCGLSATVRGEALTLAQFAELANVLSEDTGK